jgi:hypothetical protein
MLGGFGRHNSDLRFSTLRWNDRPIFDNQGTLKIPAIVTDTGSFGCLTNPIFTDKAGMSRAGLNSFFEFYTGETTTGTFSIPLEYWNKNYESAGPVMLKSTGDALLTMPVTFGDACVPEQYAAALRVHMSFLVDAQMYYNGWIKLTANIQRNGNTVSSSTVKLRNFEMDPMNFPMTIPIDDVIIVGPSDEINVEFSYQSSDIYKGIFVLPGNNNTYGNFEVLGFLTTLND